MFFSKYQGLGNDFIFFNGFTNNILPEILTPGKIVEITRPKYGVGADGVIILLPSDEADISMRLFNADGGEAELSGNGLRCAALFAREQKLTIKTQFIIKTGGGLNKVRIESANTVSVWMPLPEFRRESIPMTGEGLCLMEALEFAGEKYTASALAVGNPHCILFGNFSDEQKRKLGPVIESSHYFPRRVNVQFAKVISDLEIELTTFERGVGFTDACGTGSTAVVCAAVKLGMVKLNTPVDVVQKGGTLSVLIKEQFEEVILTGEAKKVFSGEIDL